MGELLDGVAENMMEGALCGLANSPPVIASFQPKHCTSAHKHELDKILLQARPFSPSSPRPTLAALAAAMYGQGLPTLYPDATGDSLRHARVK